MSTIHSNTHSFAADETMSRPAYQAEEGLHVKLSETTWDAVRSGSFDEGNFFARIWEAIKEFFTPSDQIEAKNAFLNFYSEKTSDQEKIDGFYKLKELAGFGNQDIFSPEVSYHAKHDGGFYKFHHLKIKVDGVETPLEREISADCNQANEIFRHYSGPITDPKLKETFELCIEALYQSPENMKYFSSVFPDVFDLVLRHLEITRFNAPDLGVFVKDKGNGNFVLGFKDNKFPEHGSSEASKLVQQLQLSAEVKKNLDEKIVDLRPAAISVSQKNDAIRLLSESMDNRPKDYSKEDHRQVRKLLEIVYSCKANFQQKEAALLNLKNQVGRLPEIIFEVAQATVSSFKGGEGAFAEITRLRMSFRGNEKLQPVEIFHPNLRLAVAGEKEAAQPEFTYRPWNAIFAIGAGVQPVYTRPESVNLSVGQWLSDPVDEFFDLEPDASVGALETQAQQRLDVSNNSGVSPAVDADDVFYDFDVAPQPHDDGANSGYV